MFQAVMDLLKIIIEMMKRLCSGLYHFLMAFFHLIGGLAILAADWYHGVKMSSEIRRLEKEHELKKRHAQLVAKTPPNVEENHSTHE